MRRRQRCIGLWLDDRERAHLMEQCAVTGLNANAYLRKLIMGESLRPRPPDAYAALLRELSAIGNNLNQIARVANTTREATPEQLAQAQALVTAAWKLLKEVV